MKRYVVLISIVLVALIAAFSYGVLASKAFGQDANNADQALQRQNMTPEQREKLREEMRQQRQRWQNISEEERAKLREQMRQRMSPSSRGMGYEQQLNSIKVIEEQLAKLKAAVKAASPENRKQMRDLTPEKRAKLREKMAAATRERYTAIRAIEQELAKLGGPGRPVREPSLRIGELQSIQKLAVEEKAPKTAERLERFIARYERGAQGRVRTPMQTPREGEPRQRRPRPARSEKTEESKTP
jgi:Spy/CpxP family protein refolding chaperone